MKKALVIITVLLLIIGAGGLYAYFEYFKADPEVQQELTDQFGEDFFTSFDEGDSENQEGNAPGQAGSSSGSLGSGAGVTEGTGTGQDSANPSAKPTTQKEIVAKYEPKFNSLQSAAMGRLNTLYGSAVQEYKEQKKAGTLDTSKLAQKYIQAGTTLEANLDSQFYSTLSAMEAELKANNIPTDVINNYKNTYESMKSSKRSELLSNIR